MGTLGSELDRGAVEESGLVWCIYIMCMSGCMCVVVTVCTMRENEAYRHRCSRQSSAGKHWVLAIMWIDLDTNHIHKHCCRIVWPAMLQKNAGEWLKEHDKEFNVLIWLPNSPNLNQFEHLWHVLDKVVQ